MNNNELSPVLLDGAGNMIKSSALLDDLTRRFKTARSKTAMAFVEMGQVAFEAKNNLSETENEQFKKDIELDGSTLRKFERIGECAYIFKEYIECLPDTWTTIYQLTRAEEKLPEVLEQGRVSPTMKGKKAAELVREIKNVPNGTTELKKTVRRDKPTSSGPDIAFTLKSTITSQMIHQLKSELETVFMRHGIAFELRLSSEMLDLAEEASIMPNTTGIEPRESEVTQ